MIKVEAVWLSTTPMDMRAGTDSALAPVVAVFGAAQLHFYFGAVGQYYFGANTAAAADSARPPDRCAAAASLGTGQLTRPLIDRIGSQHVWLAAYAIAAC